MAEVEPGSRTQHLPEVCTAFGKLGVLSFGGPIAHLGYFHREFVHKRRWLDDTAYGDLVALCQFLPGPASSQVAFALGMRRAGLLGAIAASLCFTLPSAALMIAMAYGVTAAGDLSQAGWVHGLKLAAVAIVAQAVWTMGRKLCPDRLRAAIGVAAAAVILVLPGAWTQVGVIAIGGIIGWALYRHAPNLTGAGEAASIRGHAGAVVALMLFAALLAAALLLPPGFANKPAEAFAAFYKSGSLVFGGGHVVLPLLREEVVPRNWVSDDAFLAGYAGAQAVPGPLFTFAGYLGAMIFRGPSAWLGGLWCLFAIFLPAWLLIGGALPFWHTLRAKSWAQAALRGANAAVVGVLLAAWYTPVCTEAITTPVDAAAAGVGLALLLLTKVSPVIIVASLALGAELTLRFASM